MIDFTEVNRKYFDQLATTYQDRFARAVKTITEQTQQHRLWLSDRWTDTAAGQGQEVKMLEYACGPGTVSMALAPFLTNVVGIDVASNMVDEYNRNAQAAGLGEKVTGHVADLLAESVPAEFSGPEFNDFDVVTVSMALHHFEHPDQALKRLAARLKQGGVCYIIDLVAQASHGHGDDHGHDHGHSHGHTHRRQSLDLDDAAATIKTHGFSRADMLNLFEDAGLTVGFEHKVLSEPLELTKDGKAITKTVFIARAQRV
ncbi:hypothetical protein NUU61_008220 [Penicillium alfredii]|uniref:Methyltransferase domain-containing protein n=1 Tax=Penicillium alfredii TaxID=1506179 RepID=A0A9W9ERZ2_9EURO|nr:uncharacterized protein NUU61_008220 [Penicillium alfredii]KAJ5086913.1 hypothetical protein NUU61_008220 [Penicillium alfredii]